MIVAIGLLNKEKKKWRVLGGVCRWKNSKRNNGTELILIYVSSSTSLLDVLQTHSLPLFLIIFFTFIWHEKKKKIVSERRRKERSGKGTLLLLLWSTIPSAYDKPAQPMVPPPFSSFFFCFSSCLPAAADRHLFLQDRAKKADWLTKIITK